MTEAECERGLASMPRKSDPERRACGDWSMTFDSQCDLAALVYERGDDPDRVLNEFAADLNSRGYRAVGLVQFGHRDGESTGLSAMLLHSGERMPLYQDLGPLASGCRLDPGRLLDAGAQVASAMAQGADLLIINRFGQQESEGKGLLHLIVEALTADIPLVIAVPSNRFDAWIKFADGMSVRLSCDRRALDQWWAKLHGRAGRRVGPDHVSVCEALK
jgi:nucleoside-triphosphatase THEP1